MLPTETPVTSPVLLTAATAGLDDTHGSTPAGVKLPVKLILEPAQTSVPPVIAAAPKTETVTSALQPSSVV